MEKRLLFAVILSIVVMLLYPLFIGKKTRVSPQQMRPTTIRPVEEKEVTKKYPAPAQKRQREGLPMDAISKTFQNNRYIIETTNIGGGIERIEIKDKKRLNMVLVDNAIYQAGILAIDGKGPLAGLSSQPFAIKEDKESFYYEQHNLVIEKTIRPLTNRYGLNASIRITNNAGFIQKLSFDITTASNISKKERYESRYIAADVLYKDGKLKKIAGSNFKKHKRLYSNNIEWLALKNKYYSIIAKPEFRPAGVFSKDIETRPVIGFIVDNENILPGETKIYNILLYAGPTELKELEAVDRTFGKALNFGIFTSICLVLLSVLKFFYAVLHNYGLAVLLLTCCISLLLFPLSFKSLKSMRRMQEVQPHIERIRAQHKDNPGKLNKEIMEIYRRYNVNPMGGCFPMLIQMPIFIALYQTLMRSVELKGAGFLWIKDLSMPDAAFHLPVTLPFLGNTINLLPILMIGAMIIQQRLSQVRTAGAQTDQQKMMTTIMPIVFGFIFYSLPSGLVLYWLTNTLLTSSLQYFFLRKA